VLVTADPLEPDQHRLVSQVKANWSALRPVQRHVLEEIQLERIDPETGDPIITSRMRFIENADDVDRNDLLNGVRDRGAVGQKRTAAANFLLAALSDGDWHDSRGLKTLAAAQGISERTLKREAQERNVEHQRRGFQSTTWWRLVNEATDTPTTDGPAGPVEASLHSSAESVVTLPELGQAGQADSAAAQLERVHERGLTVLESGSEHGQAEEELEL
jgi:hypothetical protein